MSTLIINLGEEMTPYKEDIRNFIDLMVNKLRKNVHKGRWENIDKVEAYNMMVDEVKELWEALLTNNKDEIFLECADVANFAMIIASITRERP